MFNQFKTITYTINDKDLSVKDLSKSFDLTDIKDKIYSKRAETNTFLDTISENNYRSFNYYHVPLYAGDILNPYKELPPTSKEVEKTINDYSAIFFTNIAGSCFSAGDLIAKSNSGFCAGFDVTDNFGYLVEVDSNINKLKALIVGSVGTGSCLIIRKENNSWGIFATFYNSLEEKYSDSAKQFLDNSEIQTSNSTILNQYYSFKSGETGINYSYNSEIDIFNNNRSIIYLIDQSAIKSFEDVMNVGS